MAEPCTSHAAPGQRTSTADEDNMQKLLGVLTDARSGNAWNHWNELDPIQTEDVPALAAAVSNSTRPLGQDNIHIWELCGPCDMERESVTDWRREALLLLGCSQAIALAAEDIRRPWLAPVASTFLRLGTALLDAPMQRVVRAWQHCVDGIIEVARLLCYFERSGEAELESGNRSTSTDSRWRIRRWALSNTTPGREIDIALLQFALLGAIITEEIAKDSRASLVTAALAPGPSSTSERLSQAVQVVEQRCGIKERVPTIQENVRTLTELSGPHPLSDTYAKPGTMVMERSEVGDRIYALKSMRAHEINTWRASIPEQAQLALKLVRFHVGNGDYPHLTDMRERRCAWYDFLVRHGAEHVSEQKYAAELCQDVQVLWRPLLASKVRVTYMSAQDRNLLLGASVRGPYSVGAEGNIRRDSSVSLVTVFETDYDEPGDQYKSDAQASEMAARAANDYFGDPAAGAFLKAAMDTDVLEKADGDYRQARKHLGRHRLALELLSTMLNKIETFGQKKIRTQVMGTTDASLAVRLKASAKNFLKFATTCSCQTMHWKAYVVEVHWWALGSDGRWTTTEFEKSSSRAAHSLRERHKALRVNTNLQKKLFKPLAESGFSPDWQHHWSPLSPLRVWVFVWAAIEDVAQITIQLIFLLNESDDCYPTYNEATGTTVSIVFGALRLLLDIALILPSLNLSKRANQAAKTVAKRLRSVRTATCGAKSTDET